MAGVRPANHFGIALWHSTASPGRSMPRRPLRCNAKVIRRASPGHDSKTTPSVFFRTFGVRDSDCVLRVCVKGEWWGSGFISLPAGWFYGYLFDVLWPTDTSKPDFISGRGERSMGFKIFKKHTHTFFVVKNTSKQKKKKTYLKPI